MMRTYFFIRHAVPHNDAKPLVFDDFERDMRGEMDLALSPLGHNQAKALAKRLGGFGIERVVSSTMQRSKDTAAILAQGLGVPYQDAFSELSEFAPGGLRRGQQNWLRRIIDLMARRSRSPMADSMAYKLLSLTYLLLWRQGKTECAESRSAVFRRIRGGLAQLDQLPERRVAIIGHGYWILFLALKVLRPSPWKTVTNLRWIENCSITRVDIQTPNQHQLRYFARPGLKDLHCSA